MTTFCARTTKGSRGACRNLLIVSQHRIMVGTRAWIILCMLQCAVAFRVPHHLSHGPRRHLSLSCIRVDGKVIAPGVSDEYRRQVLLALPSVAAALLVANSTKP